MRHPTVPIPNASTRVLVAAFMAALFTLLLLLPASGQSTFDRTDGKIGSGGLSVGVFDDIEDAQLEKNLRTTYEDGTTVYLRRENPPLIGGTMRGLLLVNDIAYLADGRVSPQQTFFGDTLYASNEPTAYNTILITAEKDRVTANADGCAAATVRSARSNNSITVQMAETQDTGGTTYYQAFVRILDPFAELEDETPAYVSSNGPACADYTTGVAHAATASILGRHGDRITIDVAGAGAVTLDVDGEGPDLIDITPEDLSYVRSRSLDFSFVVRDDDAGLRHDGELVVSADGDYTEVNGDRDHATSGEPLSTPSGGQISVNGAAADIDLKVWARDASISTARDITDTGSWTLVGNRPGVAYLFSADANDMDEGTYFMEVSAFDRAGNETVSDALDDEGMDTYLFTVDDTDPSHIEAWTGIAYEMNDLGGKEIADRSWIMIDFTEPVRNGIDPERIRVAGHEVTRVLQPQEAPEPDRTVLGRNTGTLPEAQRITFAPPAPRAAASFAPPAQGVTCPDTLEEDVNVGNLAFSYDSTTGDSTVSWTRLSTVDCHGYRLAILTDRTALFIADLPQTTSSFSIPRASEVGRAIEADIKDADEETLTVLVGLQHASVRAHTDNLGRRTAKTTRDLNDYTAPTAAVTGSVVAPFLLHPASPPATLPAIPAGDATLECGFTTGDSSWDEVVLSFTHTPATLANGWTLVGYYRQLFYPPDYDVDTGRLFQYTPIGAEDFVTSTSFQHYYPQAQVYTAQAEVVAVYEKDGRRLGARRTIGCTGTPDTTAPVLDTAVVNGPVLTLTYDEDLDDAHVPDKSAFTVTGTSRTVQSVAMGLRTVTLTLGPPVTQGETVRLTYTLPTTADDRTQDDFGNEAAAFTNRLVTNLTGDTTPPVLERAVVNGATLALTYNETLDGNSEPAGSAFDVQVDSQRRTVDSVSVSGTSVVLTLASEVTSQESVTFSYTNPGSTNNPVQDSAGNDAANLTGRSVDNNTAQSDTTPPLFESAVVNGATLTLTYDGPLKGSSAPAGSAYTVWITHAGVPGFYNDSSVSVSGKVVTLTLSTPAEYGDTVTVNYAAPGTNPIQDDAGNPAADLTDVAVRNATPNPDTDPPVFQSATVNGATLTLVYNEELNGGSDPVTGVFTVSGSHAVTAVDVVDATTTVVLTLSPAVAYEEENVKVSYTKPQTGPVIEDLAGNDAADLTNEDVTNDTPNPDQTAPVLQSREVDGTTLTLTYNEDLDSATPDKSAYRVTVDGGDRTVDSVAVTGKVVTLILNPAVVYGNVVTVSYTAPGSNPVRDLAENNAANFSALSVTNNTAFVDTTPPELVGASVDRATLILTYDEALNGSSTPGKSAYTVKVDGTEREVTTVSMYGESSVRLVLASAVERVDEVTVSYDPPSSNPVEDLADIPNPAAGFDDYDVTNNTPRDTVPPWLVTAFVNGDKLTLTYNEALDVDSVPATSVYTVEVDGGDRTVSRVFVSTVSVVLTLSSPVEFGNVVTLDYDASSTSSPIIDLARNPAGDLDEPVTNNTPPRSAYSNSDSGAISHEDALKEQGYWPEDINGEVIEDTRTRIYLQLARELKADETPDIALFGGVIHDLAGNSNVTEDIDDTRDGIAPRFTVTVTATAQDRSIANARGEYIVDVRADEDLRRRPVVYFTGLTAVEGVDEDGEDTGEYLYSIGDDIQTGSSLAAQADDDHWAGTYPASGLTGLGELFGLVVYGFDYEDNIGESGGWTPDRHQRTPNVGPPLQGNELDLTEMDEAGVLLEIDEEFNSDEAPVHAVTPRHRHRAGETESSNPFLSIQFMVEEDEYAVCPSDGCGDGEDNDNPDAEFSDSHARVNITEITLNGRDAMSMLSRVTAGRFALVASGLELGRYEVEYTAVDDAGNEKDFEFVFSVVERIPYELSVSPGWNLISFPGTPSDPSLGGVMPSGSVSPVLAYQNGDWLTAVENADGEWAGNLTQFEAGFGYWVFATIFADISPLIAEPEQTSTLPSVRVDHGWNLLGVIDIFQNPAGTPPGANGDGEADDYFGSIPWRIAYTYDTLYSLWVKTVPDSDTDVLNDDGIVETEDDDGDPDTPEVNVAEPEIINGKGYWVWSAEPGTLVP